MEHLALRLLRTDSPVGPLLLGAAGHRLALCVRMPARQEELGEHAGTALMRESLHHAAWQEMQADDSAAVLALAAVRLEEYFRGERRIFNVPLVPPARLGATPFQTAVWEVLDAIPYGRTATYGEVARAIGKPDAVRAVGRACGANPICIFRPCHRVLGQDGKLTGFAGGIDMKAMLLNGESI